MTKWKCNRANDFHLEIQKKEFSNWYFLVSRILIECRQTKMIKTIIILSTNPMVADTSLAQKLIKSNISTQWTSFLYETHSNYSQLPVFFFPSAKWYLQSCCTMQFDSNLACSNDTIQMKGLSSEQNLTVWILRLFLGVMNEANNVRMLGLKLSISAL